jgi:1-acyl-sn-glycerol-3-phosphate acyltransferase
MTESRVLESGAGRSLGPRVYERLATHGSLLLFALLCLSWSLISVPLSLLLPPPSARRVGRWGIMAVFRLYAHWLELIGAYRLDLRAIDELRHAGPLILAPNHPSLIDAILIIAHHPNLSCVMKSNLMRNILLGPGARLARYIRNDWALQMVREAVADLRQGGSLLLFPEGTRTVRAPVNPLQKSIGVIARQARVPIQTLLIETDSNFLGKGCALWALPSLPIRYRVRLGRRFDPPQDPAAFRLELERYYRSELQHGPGDLPQGEMAARTSSCR